MLIISTVKSSTLCSILLLLGNVSGTDSCGGNRTGTMGSISFPEVESYYPPNIDCTWYVTAPGNVDSLLITFQRFDINHWRYPKCNDYLKISRSDDAVLMNQCGKHVNAQLEYLKRGIRGNEMTVHFHSDNARTGRGFSLQWEVNQWRSTRLQPTATAKTATLTQTETSTTTTTNSPITQPIAPTTTTTNKIAKETSTCIHNPTPSSVDSTTNAKVTRVVMVLGYAAFGISLIFNIITCVYMQKKVGNREGSYMSPICRPQAAAQPAYYESLSPYDDVIASSISNGMTTLNITDSNTPSTSGMTQDNTRVYSEITYKEPQKNDQTYLVNNPANIQIRESEYVLEQGN